MKQSFPNKGDKHLGGSRSIKTFEQLYKDGKVKTVKIDYSKLLKAKPRTYWIPLWLRLQWRDFWYKFVQTIPDSEISYGSDYSIGHYQFRWQRLINIITVVLIIVILIKVH